MPATKTTSHDYALTPRLDIATGRIAAARLDLSPAADVFGIIGALVEAGKAWMQAGERSPLVVRVPVQASVNAPPLGDFGMRALALGVDPNRVTVEVSEAEMARRPTETLETLERLRMNGFGVALHAAAKPLLPLGGRFRGVFQELAIDAPAVIDPWVGLPGWQGDAFSRRIDAALEADITLVARGVESKVQMDALARIGFSRVEAAAIKGSVRQAA
jgi:hypothetical protein